MVHPVELRAEPQDPRVDRRDAAAQETAHQRERGDRQGSAHPAASQRHQREDQGDEPHVAAMGEHHAGTGIGASQEIPRCDMAEALRKKEGKEMPGGQDVGPCIPLGAPLGKLGKGQAGQDLHGCDRQPQGHGRHGSPAPAPLPVAEDQEEGRRQDVCGELEAAARGDGGHEQGLRRQPGGAVPGLAGGPEDPGKPAESPQGDPQLPPKDDALVPHEGHGPDERGLAFASQAAREEVGARPGDEELEKEFRAPCPRPRQDDPERDEGTVREGRAVRPQGGAAEDARRPERPVAGSPLPGRFQGEGVIGDDRIVRFQGGGRCGRAFRAPGLEMGQEPVAVDGDLPLEGQGPSQEAGEGGQDSQVDQERAALHGVSCTHVRGIGLDGLGWVVASQAVYAPAASRSARAARKASGPGPGGMASRSSRAPAGSPWDRRIRKRIPRAVVLAGSA